MKNEKNTIFLRISGKVQGVGFRYWTKKLALKLNLRGTVMNCKNNTVEIYVTGGTDNIQKFCKKCMDGPECSFVKNIERKAVDYKEFKSFDIIHK